jgi:DNA-binding CsgD family transcriptional regulator
MTTAAASHDDAQILEVRREVEAGFRRCLKALLNDLRNRGIDATALAPGRQLVLGVTTIEEQKYLLVRASSFRKHFTRREKEVAGLVAEGMTNSDIAKTLGISAPTVAGHLRRIFDKIESSSRAAVAHLVLSLS